MIIWIGRTVVHGEGWYGKAARGIVARDMLSKGSGEQVLWSPNGGGNKNLWRGGGPEMALVGGGLRPSQVHIHELVLAAVGLCWVPSAPDALQH